eukprot:COSAG02_NODE_3616_length_6473_cov_7.147160_2_plen_54_part_00
MFADPGGPYPMMEREPTWSLFFCKTATIRQEPQPVQSTRADSKKQAAAVRAQK